MIALHCLAPLKKVYKSCYANKDGFLQNPCSSLYVTSPWKYYSEVLLATYLKIYGSRVHSIYIRGSIARGTAIEFSSDVDSYCLINTPSGLADEEALENARKTLAKNFISATDVEMQVFLIGDFLSQEKYESHRFNLKLFSLCIWGESISHSISDIYCELIPHFNLRAVEATLPQIIDILKYNTSIEVRLALCQWIAKSTVRAAYEISRIDNTVYHRDIYPCALTVATLFPHLAKEILIAARFAVKPTSDEKAIRKLIFKIVPKLLSTKLAISK